MPIRTPPQHNTVHPAGCINYERDEPFYTEKINWSETDMAYKSHPKTLGDVIDNVMFQERAPVKKLTFEEWLRQSSFVEPDAGTLIWLRDCWKAAQENK